MPRRTAPPPYHHGDLREALVAAAIAHVARTGNVELTVRSLATSVGVSHAAAYRHFDGKAALLAEVARRGFARFEAELAGARAGTADLPPPRLAPVLHALATAYIRFALDEPGLFRVMWDAQIKPFDAHVGLAEAARASLRVLIDALADAGFSAGSEAPALAARHAALTVWSSVHGYATLALDGQLAGPFAIVDPLTSVSVLVDALLQGLERATKPGEGAEKARARRARRAADR